MIRRLSLLLWCQAADSSSGVGLLRPFPSSRACTEGGTFIDNHMRWSEQGLLLGIDSGDHGHYFASRAQCSRTWPDSSLSLVLRALIFCKDLSAKHLKVPLDVRVDKENSLEFLFIWSIYLYTILLVCALLSRTFMWPSVTWPDLTLSLLMSHSVTYFPRYK